MTAKSLQILHPGIDLYGEEGKTDAVVTVRARCTACNATGLYVGVCEPQGAAVVCNTCHGRGYTDVRLKLFTEREQPQPEITWVYAKNPGIILRGPAAQWGGMSLADWQAGKPFAPGMENRALTCPFWWYRASGDPPFPECHVEWGDGYDSCPRFSERAACWARWDQQQQPQQPPR